MRGGREESARGPIFPSDRWINIYPRDKEVGWLPSIASADKELCIPYLPIQTRPPRKHTCRVGNKKKTAGYLVVCNSSFTSYFLFYFIRQIHIEMITYIRLRQTQAREGKENWAKNWFNS